MALKRLLTPFAVLLLLASAAALGVYGWRWVQVSHYNAALNDGDFAAAGEGGLAHNAFARAYALEREGRLQEAQNLYHRLSESGPLALAGAARYNLANSYLRQALTLDAADSRDLMLPLAELAKTTYREHLGEAADDWSAKYNLERALQLLPDPREREEQAFHAPERGPRAVITIQADPQGLP